MGERNSVVAAPWLEQSYDTVDGWRAEATLGVKHAWARTPDSALAVQAGALWVSHPPEGCAEGGVELRWLGGRSIGPHAFLNLEAAARTLDGGCGSTRVDLTAGYRPGANWLALGQAFTELGGADEALNIQVSLVHFGERGRGLQVGIRTRLNGDEAEPALVLGFWGRPGG